LLLREWVVARRRKEALLFSLRLPPSSAFI
jgi:hypothetical protein